MAKTKKLYTEDSIESLTPLEFTRLKPGVYAGDTTYSTQLLIEILSNSIDEFKLGNGSKIEINIEPTKMSVRDYGQGFIPNSKREDGKTVLEAAFSVLNTSGKYREDGTYEGTSLGSFGIGAKISNYLSHWLTASTWRDGRFEKVYFKEGVFSKREVGRDAMNPTGTLVEWMPSEEFFTNVGIDETAIEKLLSTIVCLCPTLEIIFTSGGKTKRFYSAIGLDDYVTKAVGDKEIIKNRFKVNYEYEKNSIDLAMTYTSNYVSSIIPYVNTGLTESGPHISVIKNIITRTFNKFLRDKNILKDKDENLNGEDLQEGMYLVFNITAPGVAYDAQVKSRITKIDMVPFTSILTDSFDSWLNANEKDAKAIAEKALLARKAKEAAKKAREAVRDDKKKKEKALKFDSKLADCYSKDRTKCEIYVTEGK